MSSWATCVSLEKKSDKFSYLFLDPILKVFDCVIHHPVKFSKNLRIFSLLNFFNTIVGLAFLQNICQLKCYQIAKTNTRIQIFSQLLGVTQLKIITLLKLSSLNPIYGINGILSQALLIHKNSKIPRDLTASKSLSAIN